MTHPGSRRARSARGWLARFAAAVVATAGFACSGCPGLSGTAEEVPVELDWPDASPLGPVQPIDPASAPPPPIESKGGSSGKGDASDAPANENEADGDAVPERGVTAPATSAAPH